MRNKNKFCDNKPQFLPNPQTPPSTTDSEIEYNTQVARQTKPIKDKNNNRNRLITVSI